MTTITTRGRSAEALQCRSAQQHQSVEAAMPEARLRIGSTIMEASRRLGLRNTDIELLRRSFPKEPANPMHIE